MLHRIVNTAVSDTLWLSVAEWYPRGAREAIRYRQRRIGHYNWLAAVTSFRSRNADLALAKTRSGYGNAVIPTLKVLLEALKGFQRVQPFKMRRVRRADATSIKQFDKSAPKQSPMISR